jgi:hypothetical protein
VIEMSQYYNSINQTLTPEQIQAVRQIANGQIENKRMTTVWYNPEEGAYYLANNPASQQPDYGTRITKPHAFEDRTREKLSGGSAAAGHSATEMDELRHQPFTDEFADQAYQLWSRIDRLRKSYAQTRDPALIGAGTVTTADYSALNNVMIDATIKELIARDYVLMQAVTRKAWSKTVYTHDSLTPYRNTYDLGELDISDSASVAITRGTINLKKAQGRVSVSIWAGMAIRDHDMAAENERLVDADFERGFSVEIATTLATGTNQAAGAAWDVIAGGAFHSTTNPSAAFLTASGVVRTNGGVADTLAMNSKTFTTMIQNTYMRVGGSSVVTGIEPLSKTSARVTTHPLLPGYTIYIDELLPDGSVYIYDKSNVIFLEGPTSTRTVESNFGTIRDTVSDRWYGSGIKVAGQIREITGTTT